MVWAGRDTGMGVGTSLTGAGAIIINQEFDLFGQRLDATTGREVGPNDFRLSRMGPDGDIFFDAEDPVIVYNPVDDEYLVVRMLALIEIRVMMFIASRA